MKKSTLIVVIVALALGAFVYFYDSKHAPKTTSEDTSKPAFSIQSDDISTVTIHNAAQTISLLKKGTDWDLTQPVQTRADQATIGGLVSDLSALQIQRSFVTTDNLSKYGLANPAVKIEFQDKKGSSHSIELGEKDFSNSSVYALVDSSKQVDLLSTSLFDDATKPVSQLRDRSMIGLNGAEVTEITLNDSNGRLTVTKAKAGWKITNPRQTLADSSTVDALVSSLSSSKFTDVASETSADLPKYGLAHPTVTFGVTAGGKQFHLLLTKKGDSYYGRDESRPMIFSLDATTYNSLDKTFFDLRDKSILQFDPTAIQTVTIQNVSGTIECSQGKDDQWSVVQPVVDKGKSVQSWKILDPLQNTRATKIYDTPSAAILAHLKKPLIQITLTDKSKKTTTVNISAAAADNTVYVRTSAAPEVYEVSTQILKDLGFKISDLLT